LFEGLSRFIQAMTLGAEPAVLCLDNLHWADGATLDWLAYLGTQLRGLPLLIIGACPSDECAGLAQLRQGLSRLGNLTEVELAGLTVDEVQELLCYVTGRHAIDGRLALRLHTATGGNPFYLLQIVAKLLESGQDPEQWAALGDFPLPSSIRAAVEARLEALNEVARQVIEACAILAPAFSFDLVRLTAGRRELETLDALDSLAARRLLDTREDAYRFQHDLVRRVVETGMSPLRRRLLHRRAGRALEQLNRHAVDALAYHYEAADEPAKAAYFHELAAQRAEALFAWREAEEHRGRVRALQPQ
jgi:predicted ATPase